MPVLKASSIEYKFDLSEIKKMIAKELNVQEAAITVEYSLEDISDDRFERSSRYVVKNIKVTVDNTKLN